MTVLLALDLGTSRAKAALIDLEGRALATAGAAYPTRTTPDGGREQDPEDWVRAARAAIAGVLPSSADVAALCLTGQMQDLVLEGEGGAVHPAILYSDLRAADEARAIRARLARDGEDWDAIAGNLQDASSCAAMHRRLARILPAAVAAARGIVFGPAGHLAHVLGAGRHCDPTTAAATGLLDARTRSWSAAVARAAGIDLALLPHLTRGPGEIIGRTGADARALLGLAAGVPIVLAPGDAGAAALGVTGLGPGRDHASLGTSGWIASIRAVDASALDGGVASADPATHRLALADGAELRISAVLAAGAAADWARSAYLGGADAAEADRLLAAREREHGRGPTGLIALPSLGGERFPVRDDALRGAVLGLHATTRPIDLYAGMLEGVAFALSHGIASADGVLPVVGGGAASAPWRRILADVTGRPVLAIGAAESAGAGSAASEADGEAPGATLQADGEVPDATLLGAALAAAEALGLEHAIAPLAARGGEIVQPDPAAAAAYAQLRPAHRALYAAAQILPASSEAARAEASAAAGPETSAMSIRPSVGAAEHPELVRIWRGAVDATHEFLAAQDRDEIESRLAADYLPAVDLWVAERGGRPVGFAGVVGDGLEMLFVAADERGTGVGTALLTHAVDELGVVSVDVNEQNAQAAGFYAARGFEVVGRSETDDAGRPYPLLHLRLGGRGAR
ncbi:acetyltransferase [Brachybacterium sp. DNPG3]